MSSATVGCNVDWQNRPLYLITDGYGLRSRGQIVAAVQSALEGALGAVSCVQLREQGPNHGASDSEVLELLHALKPICAEHRVKLILNRRIDLELRNQLGPQALLGYSAHSVEEALRAFRDGASYVLLSPIFIPHSKTADRRALGVSAIQALREQTDGTVIALGGIDRSNITLCRDAGATGVAVISSVMGQSDPAEGARTLKFSWVNDY
jgi:thiamine-phosphate pyrophosphorylase